MSDNNKEIVWVDWVKCICMVLVYWDHTILYGNNSSPIIIPFRAFFVNAFFFISGYLLFRKQFSQQYITLDRRTFIEKSLSFRGGISNILFKLIIPTILFSIILFFPAYILKGESIDLKTFIFKCFFVGGNWFTCALTVAEIIIFILLLSRLKKIIYYILSTLFLAIVAVILQNNNITLFGNEYAPWFYKSGMIASLFLTLGGLYHKFETILERYNTVYVILFVCILINTNQDSIPMSTWAGISIFGFCVSIISILAVISLCKQLRHSEIVQYISRHSIGFYFLSAAIPFVCIRVCDLFLKPGALSFMCQMISSFIVALCLVYILNKYVPYIFDLRNLRK